MKKLFAGMQTTTAACCKVIFETAFLEQSMISLPFSQL